MAFATPGSKQTSDGRCDRWRILASLCVTLAPEKTPKSPLFESFLAQNQWSNRRPGQADRIVLARQRPSVAGSEPIIRRPGPALPPQAFPFAATCPLPPPGVSRILTTRPRTLSQPPPHAHPPPLRIADSRARIPTIAWTIQRYR
jgi:hypothetical protein